MRILGTNFFGHDSAVFLLDTTQRDVFALSTERCSRIKHDGHDITAVLHEHPIDNVDCIAHGCANYTVERDVFEDTLDELLIQRVHRRLMKPRFAADLVHPPGSRKWLRIAGKAVRSPGAAIWYGYLRMKKRLAPELISNPGLISFIRSSMSLCGIRPCSIDLYDHHLCHAASAYYFSPYAFARSATVLTIDGVGDLDFSRLYRFKNASHELLGCSRCELMGKCQTSIGIIYRNFTEALGFRPLSDEGKVEALAAYGEKDPALFSALHDCITVSHTGLKFDTDKTKKFYDFDFLRSEVKRAGKEACAASVQHWLEDIVVEYLNVMQATHDLPPVLCLAGGVCANIIMTLNIMERTPFKEIYIFPAMGDDGVAAGAAVLKALEMGENVSWLKTRVMPYYGPRIQESEVIEALSRMPGVTAEKLGAAWPEVAARSLASEKIVAIAQGRMEYGPRALGNRSILASPFNPVTRERLNLLVKRRPAFQPFCPSILEEERMRLFEQSFPHKHMAIAFRVREEFHEKLPSAVHVDGTARPQFVEAQDNAEYFRLLREFKRLTGFGVLINTSFNLHGRTIVRTAEDAITDFIDCGIDELYLEGYRITRAIGPVKNKLSNDPSQNRFDTAATDASYPSERAQHEA